MVSSLLNKLTRSSLRRIVFWTEDANRNCIWVKIELIVPYKCSQCFPCRLPGWCQITCALDRHIVIVVVYGQLIITIFRMPIYPVLNKANDPEYWLLIGRESGQVSHEY